MFETPKRLSEMVGNLKEIDQAIKDDEDTVNISNIEWVYPISLLPLVVYAKNNNININYTGNNKSIENYLKEISFPNGIRNLDHIKENCLPIANIDWRKKHILSKFEKHVLNPIHPELRNPFKINLKHFTTELQLNVKEHAKIDNYWVFAQYWPATKVCEICLADTGIGYMKSYKGTKYEVNNHRSAIDHVIRGFSSKKEVDRGCGVPSIIKIFAEGYRGEMGIMSGDYLFYLNSKNKVPYRCPVTWDGALICLRFTIKRFFETSVLN